MEMEMKELSLYWSALLFCSISDLKVNSNLSVPDNSRLSKQVNAKMSKKGLGIQTIAFVVYCS